MQRNSVNTARSNITSFTGRAQPRAWLVHAMTIITILGQPRLARPTLNIRINIHPSLQHNLNTNWPRLHHTLGHIITVSPLQYSHSAKLITLCARLDSATPPPQPHQQHTYIHIHLYILLGRWSGWCG